LIFDKWRVYGWIVGSDVKGFADYLELVTTCQYLSQKLRWSERGAEGTGRKTGRR
jgi:hypothetical protein